MTQHLDPGHASTQYVRAGLPRTAKLLFTALLATSLAGCGHSMTDLHHWVAQQISKPGGPVPPIPVVPPYKSYAYPGHKKDPFDSKILLELYSARHHSNVKIDPNRPRQYLEQFPLDSLKMVGTLASHGITWALIQTPNGTVQRVTIGNYMGQHDGKITAIKSGSVILREIVPDGFGGFKKQSAAIAMSQTK